MELFDTTPLGRILSRFSKDIDTIDNVMPQIVAQFLSTCFSVKILIKYLYQSLKKPNA